MYKNPNINANKADDIFIIKLLSLLHCSEIETAIKFIKNTTNVNIKIKEYSKFLSNLFFT